MKKLVASLFVAVSLFVAALGVSAAPALTLDVLGTVNIHGTSLTTVAHPTIVSVGANVRGLNLRGDLDLADETLNVQAALDAPLALPIVGVVLAQGQPADFYLGGGVNIDSGPVIGRLSAVWHPDSGAVIGDARVGLQLGPARVLVDYSEPLDGLTLGDSIFAGGTTLVGLGFAI